VGSCSLGTKWDEGEMLPRRNSTQQGMPCQAWATPALVSYVVTKSKSCLLRNHCQRQPQCRGVPGAQVTVLGGTIQLLLHIPLHCHRITESLRLERTTKIIWSNHQSITTPPTDMYLLHKAEQEIIKVQSFELCKYKTSAREQTGHRIWSEDAL